MAGHLLFAILPHADVDKKGLQSTSNTLQTMGERSFPGIIRFGRCNGPQLAASNDKPNQLIKQECDRGKPAGNHQAVDYRQHRRGPQERRRSAVAKAVGTGPELWFG